VLDSDGFYKVTDKAYCIRELSDNNRLPLEVRFSPHRVAILDVTVYSFVICGVTRLPVRPADR